MILISRFIRCAEGLSSKRVVLVGAVMALAAFVISCSEKQSIANVPCEIVSIHDDGSITVYPFVKDGVIVHEKYTGFIAGVGRLDSHRAKEQIDFLESKIELRYLSAGVNEDGSLVISALMKDTDEVVDLGSAIQRHLSVKGGSPDASMQHEPNTSN